MLTRGNRIILIVIAAFAVTALAACGTSSSSPTTTPEPSPTVTPVPVSASITIDPEADPTGFLNALPQTEVQCAASAVGGQENLIRLVSRVDGNTDGISDQQLNIMASCVSDETVASIAIGQLELQAGTLSFTTKACVSRHIAEIDFSYFFDDSDIDANSTVASLQAIFCLTADERIALETSDLDLFDFGEIGGIAALECSIDAAGPTGLQDYAEFTSGESSENAALASRFIPILIECGVMTDSDFEDTGITATQIACLFNELDEDAVSSFYGLQNDPDAEIDFSIATDLIAAMVACDINTESLLGGLTGIVDDPEIDISQIPTVSTEIILCLGDNGVGAGLLADYLAGQADLNDSTLASALEICAGDGDGEGIVIPDGNGGTTTLDPSIVESLPFTLEEIQCIVDEVGVEQLEGLANGTTSPLSLLGALGACDISLSDLANL